MPIHLNWNSTEEDDLTVYRASGAGYAVVALLRLKPSQALGTMIDA